MRADEVLADNACPTPTGRDRGDRASRGAAAQVITPTDYIGPILDLVTRRRGEFGTDLARPKRVNMHLVLPLAELIMDFYDQLKSRTSGYASWTTSTSAYREGDMVKLDVLVNFEPVDALALIVHRANAYRKGKALVPR